MNRSLNLMAAPDAPPTSIAIDNLRGVVVLIVIAVHTVLAYAVYAVRTPWPFNMAPYPWRTFPIIDSHTFLGFDIFCAWANVFLMPLFFLVSGFFVWKSLERNGARRFVARRFMRLFPPFILGIAAIMPIAIYPAYAERTAHPHILDYLQQLRALPFWPDGPMWFLFVLLVFDAAAAVLHAWFSGARSVVARLSLSAQRAPKRFLLAFFVLSALAYIPLGTIFGPMRWFQWGPFSFQLNFIALYVVYFGAGAVVGAAGVERGILNPDLARQWKKWVVAALGFFVVWLLVSAKTFTKTAPSTGWMLADAIALVPACFASSLCVLLVAVQFGRVQTHLLQSLRANAFGMYWVHYAIVAWLQFALLSAPFPAVAKAFIVFVAAAGLSWTGAAMIRQVPLLKTMFAAVPGRSAEYLATLRSAVPLPD